jgi:hypothetical protein
LRNESSRFARGLFQGDHTFPGEIALSPEIEEVRVVVETKNIRALGMGMTPCHLLIRNPMFFQERGKGMLDIYLSINQRRRIERRRCAELLLIGCGSSG